MLRSFALPTYTLDLFDTLVTGILEAATALPPRHVLMALSITFL